MNKLIKKVLVGITAATMMFGSVCTAYAATDSATVAPAPEKQTNVKADNGAKVSTAANGTATVKALPKTTKKSVTVASKVVVDGVSYKVTAIGAKAFANATKATTVTLPASSMSSPRFRTFLHVFKKNIMHTSIRINTMARFPYTELEYKFRFRCLTRYARKKETCRHRISSITKSMCLIQLFFAF